MVSRAAAYLLERRAQLAEELAQVDAALDELGRTGASLPVGRPATHEDRPWEDRARENEHGRVTAPDGPGLWRGGLPGQRPINLRVSPVAVTPEHSASAVPLDVWLTYHPGWRYQRHELVTVPPRP